MSIKSRPDYFLCVDLLELSHLIVDDHLISE